MKSRIITLLALVSLAAVGSLVAEDASKVDWAQIKCVMNPKKAVNVEKHADYKGAKIYFCCPGCAGSFAKEPAKFAAKANHQLVATHQAKQEKCPMSGKAVDATKTVKIGGVEVAFCCGNCKSAAEGKEGDEQVDLVFGDKAFEKGFKVTAK